jgi:hypothetical protein
LTVPTLALLALSLRPLVSLARRCGSLLGGRRRVLFLSSLRFRRLGDGLGGDILLRRRRLGGLTR